MRAFLDANIFFAAAGSPNGGSGLVLDLAKARKFEPGTILYVILEAERNIREKLGEAALIRHYENLSGLKMELYPLPAISARVSEQFGRFIVSKDVPILLGALSSRSDFLVTLDKRDFLENDKLKTLRLPFQILSPGDFLTQITK